MCPHDQPQPGQEQCSVVGEEGPRSGWGWGGVAPPLKTFVPSVSPFQLALGAALVNVQIPLLLGQLVEVVAKYTRDHVGSFMTESQNLSTHLLILYGVQVQPGVGLGAAEEPPEASLSALGSCAGTADLRVPGAAVPRWRAHGCGHAEGPLQLPAPVLPAAGCRVGVTDGLRGLGVGPYPEVMSPFSALLIGSCPMPDKTSPSLTPIRQGSW